MINASQALFGRGDLAELDERTLDAVMAEIPNGKVDPSGDATIVDLLLAGGLVDSKGAARRTLKEGGAYVNNVKIADEEWKPEPGDALHGKWLVVRKGKRNVAGVALGG